MPQGLERIASSTKMLRPAALDVKRTCHNVPSFNPQEDLGTGRADHSHQRAPVGGMVDVADLVGIHLLPATRRRHRGQEAVYRGPREVVVGVERVVSDRGALGSAL